MYQDPREALPAVTLHRAGEVWTARRDLLASGRFAQDISVAHDRRVRPDDHRIGTVAAGNGIDLGSSNTLHVGLGRLVWNDRFVDVRRVDDRLDPDLAEQLETPG